MTCGIVLLATLFFAGNLLAQDGEAVTPKPAGGLGSVKGWIEVAESDEQGKPRSLYLWDEVSDEFIDLETLGKGKELFEHVGRRIEAKGLIKDAAEEGRRRLEVQSYVLLDEFDAEPTPAPAPETSNDDDEGTEESAAPAPAPDDDGAAAQEDSFSDDE